MPHAPPWAQRACRRGVQICNDPSGKRAEGLPRPWHVFGASSSSCTPCTAGFRTVSQLEDPNQNARTEVHEPRASVAICLNHRSQSERKEKAHQPQRRSVTRPIKREQESEQASERGSFRPRKNKSQEPDVPNREHREHNETFGVAENFA